MVAVSPPLIARRVTPRRPTPRRLTPRRLIGLALLFNLPFVLLQAQRGAYDTDSHIFLADHYRRAWFSLWETRWYLGFSLTSYPPLVHQLIALLSWPIGWVIQFFAAGAEAYPGAFTWVAEETGFVLLLLAALALLPLALRAFARLFVGPRASDLAGLLAIFLPATSLTAWTFGQLPTLLATGVVLLALERGARFARGGRPLHLLQAVALAAVAGAAHHGVFLLVPFAGAAVAGRVLAESVSGQPRDWRRRALRLGAWGLLSGVAVAAVLWPFLLWSHGQPMQTPIDHASRHNFLFDSLARGYFFWPMYGPLLVAVPLGVWLATQALRTRASMTRAWWATRASLAPAALATQALRAKPASPASPASRAARALLRWKWLPLLLLLAILFVLGLGGTTPLPQWLFGAGWAWLTYDRFAFWAALLSLPLVGSALLWLWHAPWRWGRPASIAFVGTLLASAVVAGWLGELSHSEPPPIDLAPLAVFLDQPTQQPYRYFTLGFGDQMAKLSALTQNGTPDGDYHTARTLPELRTSGLGAIDGAVWNPQGAQAAAPLLVGAARYGARWAFVAHTAYVPILLATGWRYFTQAGTVQIWEHPDVKPVPALPPAVPGGRLAALWWGVAPLAALALAVALLLLGRARPKPARADVLAALRRLRRAGWVLTIALLAFWWMQVLRLGYTPTAYFTYDSVIVYAVDVAAAATLLVWLAERALRRERLTLGPHWVAGAGLALLAATALSAITSGDRLLSASIAAHLLLAAGWYGMLVNDPPEAALVGQVLAVWLAGETAAVLIEAVLQNTLWLRPLYLPWPGLLIASMPGASVIQNAAGARWLRGYGTLPHPNTLGGFVLLGLGVAVERYLSTGRRVWLGVGALATVTLVLTFSRASWLAAGVMLGLGAVWVWRCARDRWPRYRVALASLGLVGVLALLPLWPLLAVRADFSDPAVSTELRSVQERQLYALVSLHMLADRPLFGVGAGTFVEVLSGLVPPLTRLEPVHNVILLVTTETGLLGGLALLALVLAVAWRAWRRRRLAATAEMLWALVLLGIFVTGLLDHYWWTAPPGQLAVATALGLWAASAGHEPLHDQVALDARSETLGGLQADPHKVGADSGV